MTYLLDIFKMLAFRSRSLRALAARQSVVAAFICLAIGFFTFVFVRSSASQEILSYVRDKPSYLEFFLDTHVLQMLLFLSLVYVPAIVALSNAFAGDGLGFSISRSEYASHLSALFPLWGLLFLIGAPLIPYFVPLGLLEISVGELWLMVAMAVYTVWAVKEMDFIPIAAASGVVMLSLFTLPILFALTNFMLVLPFFLVLPLLYVFLQRFRELLATRTLLHGFREHLRTLTLNPRDADAHFQLGLLHFRNGHLDAARGYFEQALEINPQDADHHYYMGRIYEAAGAWAKAAEAFEAAYRLNPEYGLGDICREVGKGYLHTGNPDKALEFLEFFLDRRGSDPEGRYWFAVALHRSGKLNEMRVQLNTILDQARSSPRFFRRQHREWIYRSRVLLRGEAD
jgi:tetratricopeptide (TPR) repeat protein